MAELNNPTTLSLRELNTQESKSINGGLGEDYFKIYFDPDTWDNPGPWSAGPTNPESID